MRAIAELTCLHCGEVNAELLLETATNPWCLSSTRRCRHCGGPLYLAEFISVPARTPVRMLRHGRGVGADARAALADATSETAPGYRTQPAD